MNEKQRKTIKNKGNKTNENKQSVISISASNRERERERESNRRWRKTQTNKIEKCRNTETQIYKRN